MRTLQHFQQPRLPLWNIKAKGSYWQLIPINDADGRINDHLSDAKILPTELLRWDSGVKNKERELRKETPRMQI